MPAAAVDTPRVQDLPSYWFLLLEDARLTGDFERAAQAKRQLARLGVHVSYGRPSLSKRKGAADAI
jgi:hypothetical protein